MTTTQLYSGLNSEKNSSRVLRPPGGASSNIFGAAEEQAAPAKPTRKQDNNIFGPPETAAQSPKKTQQADSNIFGDTAASPNKGASKTPEEEEEEKKKEQEEREREEKENKEKEAAAGSNKTAKTTAGYNPITGEAYKPPAQANPSTRVRQPPGGASSGLW